MSTAKKFRELVLYVAKLTEGDPRCGRTKLNKILFYADFGAYRRFGRSISGQKYFKREFGPVPGGLPGTVDAMVEARECAWASRDHYGRTLQKLVALREPDLSVFDAAEVDVVRQVVEELWERNATEVSDLSHRFVGWQAAGMGDEIPYNTVLIGPLRPLSDDEVEWARQAIREFREHDAAAG
ncbi:MAG: SocA family protein [Chloroflexi bacterium]|nr:SocA family protein [Chloroflexota bacterium]